MARTLDIIGFARGVLGFTRSVLKDVTAELRKWATSPKNQKGVGVFAVFIIVMVGMFSYQASSIKLGAQFGPMQPSSGKPVSFTCPSPTHCLKQ